jgi:hypothetical protein
MPAPNSRESLIDYAFRSLGSPVIEINVDMQQAYDRLDDALQFFAERHFDGVDRCYFDYVITQQDIDRKYVNTNAFGPMVGADPSGRPDGRDILSIIRIFPFGTHSSNNFFDIRYQLALNDFFGINTNLNTSGSTPVATYDIAKRYIRMIEMMFDPERSIRFSKVTNKLQIETDWSDMQAGTHLAVEAYVILDPERYPEIYNDILLKKYVTALIKRQWGANLSKFDGVQLPGGIVTRGSSIFSEAIQEIAILEEQVRSAYEYPPDFMTG